MTAAYQRVFTCRGPYAGRVPRRAGQGDTVYPPSGHGDTSQAHQHRAGSRMGADRGVGPWEGGMVLPTEAGASAQRETDDPRAGPWARGRI